MGVPKALVRTPDGTAWVVATVRTLRAAGLDDVVVVVGAAADEVRAELEQEGVDVVEAEDWADGMGASLRVGLRHAGSGRGVGAVLVALVDTPGLTPQVVRRIATRADAGALVRATYRGVPGHPVLLGSEHLAGILDSAGGDVGAREYLRSQDTEEVECADVASGEDVDTPGDLPPGTRLG